MSDVKFNKGARKVAPAPEAPTEPAPSTPAVPTGVPARRDYGFKGGYTPTSDDVMIPRINLVANMGALKDQFPPGSYVLSKTLSLYVPTKVDTQTGKVIQQGTEPLKIVAIEFGTPCFVEKVDGGARGAMVKDEAAVVAAGGTTDWREWDLKKATGIKFFQRYVEAVFAIAKPEHIKADSSFSFNIDGVNYAIVKWAMKGTAFTRAAKQVFFTAAAFGGLQPPSPGEAPAYSNYAYSLSSKEDGFGGSKKAWVPICICAEQTTDAFKAFAAKIREAVNSKAADSAEGYTGDND